MNAIQLDSNFEKTNFYKYAMVGSNSRVLVSAPDLRKALRLAARIAHARPVILPLLAVLATRSNATFVTPEQISWPQLSISFKAIQSTHASPAAGVQGFDIAFHSRSPRSTLLTSRVSGSNFRESRVPRPSQPSGGEMRALTSCPVPVSTLSCGMPCALCER
jgi:hypothetical protein